MLEKALDVQFRLAIMEKPHVRMQVEMEDWPPPIVLVLMVDALSVAVLSRMEEYAADGVDCAHLMPTLQAASKLFAILFNRASLETRLREEPRT